ncbi:unnamed protein product [Rotaria magnacalcarata]|uniref:Uncharacterized protein n=4 Tax=Rotaria magnacalcarata TaxID=392030 RepID=A0A816UPM0_9BILA|nr:unnamed protein product [Rotaria magnacalcarata]CAF2149887.1 unnamed protein product [Rotaria magnacalcarata]
MISKSILIDLTNCTIGDRSENENNVNSKDSHRTQSSLSNTTTTHEHDPGSESNEVLGDDTHYINSNNKKIKVAKNKAIAISRNNCLTTTTIETTSVQSSQVWKYAIRCPNSNFSICSLCPNDKKISTNNGSTSTLRKHLISEHQLHELALPNNKRKRIDPQISNNKKQHLHDLFIKCVIRDGRTFKDLQKPGLKKILQELIPGYEPPTRYSVARQLKRLYKLYLKKLIDDLALIGDISITLDLCSNKQMRSFLVITGHYFPKNGFDLQSTVLNFSTFNVHHTSVDILRVLQEKLKELDILHKVVRVTSDGGRNVVRAVRNLHLNLERVWCVAHRLHLAVTNAFGFWILQKDDENGSIALEQDNLNNGLNYAEKEMANIERLDNNDDIDEPDEINMNVTRDESDDDESSETYDSNDEEESLLDNNDEEFVDDWTTNVIQSDFDIACEQNMIIIVIKKCRGLVSMIKRSTIITLYFDTERKQANIKRNLCYDVKSRWNSTFSMIDSFLVLRQLIQKLFSYKHQLTIQPKQVKKLADYELTSDDWNVLLVLHSILKPFYHATKVMSGRQYPSIGLAFYLLTRLKNFLQQNDRKESSMEKRLKQLLLKQLLHYFESDDEQMELLKLHSYFDPAGFSTFTESEKRSVEQNIKQMVTDGACQSSISVTNTLSISPTTTNSPNTTNSTGNLNKSAIDMFNESIGDINYEDSRRGENTRATIVNEFQNYRKYATQFNLKHKPDATSAIIFWRTYGDTFSILKGLAKKMLSTPATSVPSESCFSLSSSLGRKERARLTGDNLSSSVFLKDKINF